MEKRDKNRGICMKKICLFRMGKIRDKFRESERRRLKSEIGRFHGIEVRTLEIFAKLRANFGARKIEKVL